MISNRPFTRTLAVALVGASLVGVPTLAADATGAALAGRDTEFKAAAAALDSNSVDLSKSIGSVYGADAESAFLALWRRHIGFVVDYTVGLARKDKAMQDKAVTSLLQYSQDFGAFLGGVNPNLPKSVVANLVVRRQPRAVR